MILVTGGAYSGKIEYVISELGFCESDISPDLNSAAPVLSELHLLLKDIDEVESILPDLLDKKVIVCDELGCGIVPTEQKDRLWRERVGRVCCRLAENADAVVRLNCGIASVIKGKTVCTAAPLKNNGSETD